VTGKEKSAVCQAVARGIAACWNELDALTREHVTYAIGDELEQLLGAGFNGERLELSTEVARMTS
jgi:hypothetical protein